MARLICSCIGTALLAESMPLPKCIMFETVQHKFGALMMLTDRKLNRSTQRDEQLLTFDVSDEALERAAPIIGGVASVETLNFATAILGNCACPV
jgi:hypothetical protein